MAAASEPEDPFAGQSAADVPLFDTDPFGASSTDALRAGLGVLGIVDAVLNERHDSAKELVDTMTFRYALMGVGSVVRTMLHECPVRDRILDSVLIAAGAKWSGSNEGPGLLRMIVVLIAAVRCNAEDLEVPSVDRHGSAVLALAWMTYAVIVTAAVELAEDPTVLRDALRRFFLAHLAAHHAGGSA